MLQESGFARQTRQPTFSLEAVRPRQRVLAPLPVIFISQSRFGSRRNQHAEPSPLVPFTRRGCVMICESVRNLGIIFRVTFKDNLMKSKKLFAVVFGSLVVLALSLPVMAQDTTQSTTTTTTQNPPPTQTQSTTTTTTPATPPQTQTTQTKESTTKYKHHHKKVKKEKQTTTTTTTPPPQ